MEKRFAIILGVSFFFISLFSFAHLALAAFESVPDVGPSGCVTYAQARAQGITGTDAQLHSMGFCSGGEESTNTLPTSGTYDELWAAWEKYCRWGTEGITQAQCDQLYDAALRANQDENTPPAETPETIPTETPEETTPDETPEETTEWDEYYTGMTLEQLNEERQKNDNEQDQCMDEQSACFDQCGDADDCTKQCLNDLTACDDPCWATRDTCFTNCHYCEECNTNQEACSASCSAAYDTCCDNCYATHDSCLGSCANCRIFIDKGNAIDRAREQKEREETPVEIPEEIPEAPQIPEAPTTPEAGIGEDTSEVQDFDSLLADAKQKLDKAVDTSDVNQLNLMLLNALSSVSTGEMTDEQLEDYIHGLQPMVLNALLNMRDPIDAMKATWYLGALNKAIETEKQKGNQEALSRLKKDYYDMVEAAAKAFEGQQIKGGTLDKEELASLAAMAKGMRLAVAEYKQSGEEEKASKAQDAISRIDFSLNNNREQAQFIAKETLDTETTAAFNLYDDIGTFEARQAFASQEKLDKATQAYIAMLESRDKMFQSKDSDEIEQLQKDAQDSKIEAISQFKDILESDKYDSRANFALGTIYAKDGDSETARVLYGRGLLGLKGTKDFDKMSAAIKSDELRKQVLSDLGVSVQPESSTSLFMKRLGDEGSGLVSNAAEGMRSLYRDAELWSRSLTWSDKMEDFRDKIGEGIFSASKEKAKEAAGE